MGKGTVPRSERVERGRRLGVLPLLRRAPVDAVQRYPEGTERRDAVAPEAPQPANDDSSGMPFHRTRDLPRPRECERGICGISQGLGARNDNVAGYSKTPLAKKLGLKAPIELLTMGAPTGYPDWLGALPEGVALVTSSKGSVQAAHVFATKRADLAKRLGALRTRLEPAGFVWVSWPKKASKVATDVTEDTIRELALPLGFVDIKVCAVTDVWSGLKLVIRRSERQRT